MAEGGRATYTVALVTQPSGQVTVTVGGMSGTDLSVDESSLTFSASDWSTAQTVEVTAGEDPDGTDDIATLTHTATGADYGSVSKGLDVTVTDNDTVGLELSETTLTVAEGGRATYTVALVTQPSGPVTVTVGGTANTDLSVDESSLTFSASDWSTAQTVEVTAGEDPDTANDSETLTHTATGADYGSVSKDLAVTVTDDDTVGLELSETTLTVAEGGSATYTVALVTEPSGPVTVTIGGTANTDLSVDESSLTFSASDWSTAQTVEVTAGEDPDTANDSETLTHTATGADYGSVSKDLAVTVTDDDTVGLDLSETTLTVAEGGSATYTVALVTEPSGQVTVTIGGTANTDLSVDESSLTFSASDWSTAQTVEVTAGEDPDTANDSETLTHTATGADYGSVSKGLDVTVTDNDTVGLHLSEGALTVAEGGRATYTVALVTQPSGPVTVTVGGMSGTDLSVDESSLTFSASDWSTAQTVEVTAGEDPDGTDDSETLTHTATGADYGSVSKGLDVTVTDNDTVGLELSETTLTVAEGGRATYTVALVTQPSGPVTVTVGGMSGTDLSVDESSLTFSASDWSTAQTVEVTAGEDPDGTDDSETLTHTATGADYGSVSKGLDVTVTDNDTVGLELSETTLTVAEGGRATYTVALVTQPSGPVTVTVGGMSGTDLSVDESSLTFSASDWSTAQTVEVTAGEDPDTTNDSETLTHTATGADYGSVSKGLDVTVTDNDTVGLELSETTLTVAEGGRATYTVALVTEPSGQVTVTVGGTANTDLSVDESSLTFSASDWSTAQTVEVTAGEDPDGTDDIATLTHTATGADYGSVSKGLDVTVTDNDTVGLHLSEGTLTVAEGGRATYTVALVTQPSGPVTVTVGGMSGTDLSVDESSLTFSASDWSTAQTVEVTAGEDPDGTDDSETLTHTATGADYGSVSKGLDVTVTDNDTVGLELSETTLTVAEGGRATYTVALVTEPSGQVTVTVGGTANTDLSVDESSLTFSASDWSTAQTVEVTAGEDPDTANDSETLTHTATGADYGSVSKDLAVTVTDNDTVGLELSETTLTVAEGGRATYTVALVTQPSGPVTVTVGGMSGTDLSVDESSLTFSASDWSTAQTVEVTAGEDPDTTNDSETLTHTATGADYGSVSKGLDVTVTDNDTVGLHLSGGSLTVAEGGRATYTVALVTQPSGPVTVTVGGMSGTDLSVDESSLTFSASDWSTAQTVEVTAGEDPDGTDDSETLTHTATGADYGSVSKGLDVTVTDNDTVGLELSETTLTVAEGGRATYTVALVTQPSGPVTVTVGGMSGTDLSVDESSLTFSASDWSTAQTVEVTAGEDPDGTDDSETLTHTATGADYGSVSKGLDVTVTDNDTVGLELSETTLTVAEGGRATYTVALVTEPSGQVTVTVGGTANTDLSVDESSLTFSASDWSTAQTVEVTAGEDPDTTNDSETLTHTATGADYGSVSKDLDGDGDGQRHGGAASVGDDVDRGRRRPRDVHGGAGDGAEWTGDGDGRGTAART